MSARLRWARSAWAAVGARRAFAPAATLLLAAILLIIYTRPVFVLLVLAAWTFLVVRLICVPASVSLRTLATYLLLGMLGGTIVLPFVPTLVAPYASYDLLPRDWPILLVLVEALKIAVVLAPVAYLLLTRHASTPLRIVDAFLLAFMTGLGADLVTYLLIASAAPPTQVVALSWVPPWQAIRGARVVAGYAYWAGLTAMALAAADRFLRDRRAVIAGAAMVLAYAVADATFAGSLVHRFTSAGRLTAWLTLVAAAVFSVLEARWAGGPKGTAPGESRVRAAWAALAGALQRRDFREIVSLADRVLGRRDRPLLSIRTLGQVALWLLLAFTLIVLPRMGQGLQDSFWSTLLFRVGPSFLPPVVNAALMLTLLGRYLLVAGGQAASEGTGGSIAAFGAQLTTKTALGAVAIVLFGLALVDEYPYQLVTQSFNQFRIETLLLLLAVVVTGTSIFPPTVREAPASRWRHLLLREGSRVTALARGLVLVWLGLTFYRASASLIASVIGYERIYAATMLAALGTAGISFGLSYAVGSFLSRQGHALSVAKRLVRHVLSRWSKRRAPADG